MDWITTFLSILTPHMLFFLMIGVIGGAVIGALPGLSATMGIAILTPLTFWFSPAEGFAMLIGLWNSAIWAGGISAILINTPGTPASIATTFDGYEFMKRGEAGLALGINTVYSAIGGLFSTFVCIFISFPMAKFALKFGPPEYFVLGLFGLTMMISVSGSSILKGLLVGFLGLLISCIGADPMLAFNRYSFSNANLINGISFIPVMIGMFGIGEVLYQIYENRKTDDIAERQRAKNIKMGRIFVNRKEAKRLIPTTIMSSLISVVVGAIPATGGDISSVICWGQAKRMSKHPEEFGKGSIEGLATSCVANNGVIGGALATMLTLGIPGDSVSAVLIGSLMMYGMQPGPMLFTEHKDFVITIMCLMIAANLAFLIFGLATTKVSAKVLTVNKKTVWVVVTLLCIVGSFALNNSMFDVLVMALSGFLGFLFKKMDYAAGPFILGLLLGHLVESNFRRSLALSQGSYSIFVSSPIVIVLEILIVLSIVVPVIRRTRKPKLA